MTNPKKPNLKQEKQKATERYYVEEAAKLLGVNWNCIDREEPDFIVTEGDKKFGLEVREVFKANDEKENKNTTAKKIISVKKKNESDMQKHLNKLCKQYKKLGGTGFVVEFLGRIKNKDKLFIDNKDILNAFPKELRQRNFDNQPPGFTNIIEMEDNNRYFKAFVKKRCQAHWYCLCDQVGWVNSDPEEQIRIAIHKKSSEKLKKYKENTGLDDIRLLLVADRTQNSGKLQLPNNHELDTEGFQKVYFFSYPRSVIEI